jgi:putative endonuclease
MKAEPPEPSETSPERDLAEVLSSSFLRLKHHPRLRRLLMHRIRLDRCLQLQILGKNLSRPEIGELGEILAAKHLRQHGRRVLFRNYRGLHRGEVDIVARHGQILTFVEVKTRTSTAFGRPADAVNAEKQRLIQRGAQDWLRQLGNPRLSFRFDIAEVILIPGEVPYIHIIDNAFVLPDSSTSGR